MPEFADAVLLYEIERLKADLIETVPGGKCEWRDTLQAPRRIADEPSETETEVVDGDAEFEDSEFG